MVKSGGEGAGGLEPPPRLRCPWLGVANGPLKTLGLAQF